MYYKIHIHLKVYIYKIYRDKLLFLHLHQLTTHYKILTAFLITVKYITSIKTLYMFYISNKTGVYSILYAH